MDYRPRTQIAAEYIMTLHAPLDAPHGVSGALQIFNVRPGGWARGPRLRGEIVTPSGDWLRISPEGSRRLDVRLNIRTDDGALIFMAYTGRAAPASDAVTARLAAGETLGPDALYFMIAPTFETAAPAYAWLNDLLCIGKAVSINRSNDRHVTYDIFAVS